MRLGNRRLRLPRPRFERAADTGRDVLTDVVGIVREMVRMPAALYMGAAERAGALVLAGWLRLWPWLERGWRQAVAGFRVAEREVTPWRAALAVGVATALALAASQFADYRTITIGSAAYADLEQVAGAPEVGSAQAGSAHAWLGLPLAAAALFALYEAASGSRRAAWALVPIGVAVVLISLAVDLPKGLDEGAAAVAYEGAGASLLGGFWAQLVSGVLLAGLAPLLAYHAADTSLPQARGDSASAQGDSAVHSWAGGGAG